MEGYDADGFKTGCTGLEAARAQTEPIHVNRYVLLRRCPVLQYSSRSAWLLVRSIVLRSSRDEKNREAFCFASCSIEDVVGDCGLGPLSDQRLGWLDLATESQTPL
jgi:hypothetical protein